MARYIGFSNAAQNFVSFLRNLNSAIRTYTFQDRDGTIADLADIQNVTVVSISTTAVLNDTAFGKIHECTDSGSDYTITLPAPSADNGQKTIFFKGLNALTKVVTLSNGAITIDGDANVKFSRGGLVGLKSDGTNYTMVALVGSWIPLAGTPTGFASFTVNDVSYLLENRKVIVKGTLKGTGNTTLTTVINYLPFTSRIHVAVTTIVTNVATNAAGLGNMVAGSSTITFYATAAGGNFTSSVGREVYFQFIYER